MQNLGSAHRTAFYNTVNIWMTLKKKTCELVFTQHLYLIIKISGLMHLIGITSIIHFDFTLNFDTVQVG